MSIHDNLITVRRSERTPKPKHIYTGVVAKKVTAKKILPKEKDTGIKSPTKIDVLLHEDLEMPIVPKFSVVMEPKAKNKKKILPKEKVTEIKSPTKDDVLLHEDLEISTAPKFPVVTEQKLKRKKRKRKTARRTFRGCFSIECRLMELYNINLDDLKKYLQDRMKVDGNINDGRNIRIGRNETKVFVHSVAFIKKSYIKFMTKTFLKRARLHNLIQVHANGRNSFELRLK